MAKSGEPEIELTGAQLRAARALLDMSANALAVESKVSLRTIRRAEDEHGPVSMTAANVARIVEVILARGARLTLDENGPGVALRLKPKPKFGD